MSHPPRWASLEWLRVAFASLLLLTATLSIACVDMIGPSFVLCSSMQGTLVDKDLKPVSGIKVERKWKWAWTNQTGVDSATTDEQGRFAFPKVVRRSLTAGIVPHEPGINQTITAFGTTGATEVFSTQKRDYAENGENKGRPLDIVCRIDMEPGATGKGFWGTVIEVR